MKLVVVVVVVQPAEFLHNATNPEMCRKETSDCENDPNSMRLGKVPGLLEAFEKEKKNHKL